MIRLFTLFCVALAGLAGMVLYHVKHEAQLLERQIVATMRATDAARERSTVLQAEWTQLGNPERLALLSDQFLDLVTVAPRQFTSLSELGNRLPPARAPGWQKEDSTDEPETNPVAEAPLPLPPPLAPPLPPARIATTPAPLSSPAASPRSAASSAPPRPVPPAPAASASPPMASPSMASAAVARVATPAPPALVPASVPSVSALGMARMMTPQPLPASASGSFLPRGN